MGVTGHSPALSHINQALLHLGGTRVLGVLVTMDAKQGVEPMKFIRPSFAIPIHYNDYIQIAAQ